MTQTIRFFVAGIPQSRGSKRAFPFKRKSGGLGVRVTDNNPKSKDWMSHVTASTIDELEENRGVWREEIWNGPVGLRLTFIMPRPKSHYGTGKNATVLKPYAPKYHTSKPDRGKLQRAVEDALTGIAYLDDSQVCAGPIEKVYGDRPGVEIEITAMGTQVKL